MQELGVFHDLPTLETGRLLLRKIGWPDLAEIYEYSSDPEVARYVTWDPHRSLDDTGEFVNSVLESYAAGEPAPWGIVRKADGKLMGTGGFMDWKPEYGRIELGYALGRPYWGQGSMTEAGRAMIDFGFERLAVHRIQAYCILENVGSARVLEKCGMTLEGVLRQYTVLKGQRRDLMIFSILRDEWAELYLSG